MVHTDKLEEKALFTDIFESRAVDSKFRIQLPIEFKKSSTLPQFPEFLLFQSQNQGVVVAQYFNSNKNTVALGNDYPNFSKLVKADKDRRIPLPPNYRDHLGLVENETGQRLVTLVGRGDNIHIIGQSAWEKLEPNYRDEHNRSMEQRPELAVPPAPK